MIMQSKASTYRKRRIFFGASSRRLLRTIGGLLIVLTSMTRAQEVIENVGNLRPTLPKFVEQQDKGEFQLPKILPEHSQKDSNSPSFVLKSVIFTGNSVFTDAQLQRVINVYVDRQITISDLEAMRVAITQHYISEGFINSGAVLPSQDVSHGKVQIQIVEGTLDQINVTGIDGLDPHYIKLRLLPDNNSAFNLKDFQERYQLLLNNPMFDTFQGKFKPGIRPGQSSLDLTVVPASPFGVNIQADNHGVASSGEEQLSLHSYYLNPLGVGDNVAITLRKREGAVSGNLLYQVPLNYSDTLLTVQYSFNDSEVIDEQIQVLDIESEFRSTDISISHPVISSLTKSVTVSGSLSVRENQGRLLQLPFSFASGENNGLSRVSVLRLSAQGSIRTSKDVWSGHIRYSHGIKAFNATNNNNQLPDSDFSVLLMQLQYARLLSDGWQFSWRADAQLSNDGLLPLEQFAIGGANTIRGYRENELVRDEGFSTSVQLTVPLFDELDYSGRLGSLDGYVFSDFGEGSFRSDIQDTADALWSVGMGFVWEFTPDWQVEAVFAHAINDPQSRPNSILQDEGIHVRISGVLL